MVRIQHFVSYLRVSTARQGRSGLGLEAQREAVRQFVAARGGAETHIHEYVEVESGKNDNRPELDKALKRCRQTRATLVVAKLDRLSRNAEFLLRLQNGNVKFVAADLPDANELTVGFMAIIAQHERKAISDRTKAALAAAQVRRKAAWAAGDFSLSLLGGFRTNAADIRQYQADGVQALREIAKKIAEENREDIEPLVRQGMSLRAIAANLDDLGICPPRGSAWSAQGVKNMIERLGIARNISR